MICTLTSCSNSCWNGLFQFQRTSLEPSQPRLLLSLPNYELRDQPFAPIKACPWDFLCSSVVKISPSNARGTGSIPGWGAKIPHVSWPKNQNVKQKQIVTNSVKTLKMVRIKKKISKAKRACHPFFPFAARTKYQGQCHIVLLFYGLSKCLPWETAPEK